MLINLNSNLCSDHNNKINVLPQHTVSPTVFKFYATKAKLTVDAGAVKDVVTLDFDWSQAPSKVSFTLDDANILTKMDGAYLLKSLDADSTSVTYELSVGLSMPIPAMMIAKQEKSTIDGALKQLKEHLEG